MTPSDALPPTPATLDAAALARLHALDPDGRMNVVTRVLQTYDTSLARMLGEFADAERRADWEAAGRLAHTLKSSSTSVGALELAARCAALERRTRDDPTGDAGADVAALRAEGVRVLAAVQAMLRGR